MPDFITLLLLSGKFVRPISSCDDCSEALTSGPSPLGLRYCISRRQYSAIATLLSCVLSLGLSACFGPPILAKGGPGDSSGVSFGSGASKSHAALTGVSCTDTSITGTGTDSCTVTLNVAAGSSGLPVSLSSSNADLTVPSSVMVAAGATSARFVAAATAASSAQKATLTASDGQVTMPFVINLGGENAILTLQSTSVDFGNVTVGSAAYQSATLTSSGTEPLIIGSGWLTGTGFTVPQVSLPVTLNPGQTATLQIEFDPTTAGPVTGAVVLTSNSSAGALSTISLSGTGKAGAYEVNVTWYAPASSAVPIEGYYIYRAVSGSTTYWLMNSTVDPFTAYTDTTVAAGTTYVYYVKSVDDEGVTSAASSPITVTVP